jgi:2-keto-4-pentenoate hydratase
MAISLAQSLVNARANQATIKVDSLPNSVDEAYLMQQAVIDATNDSISGLKIGATNTATQSVLGLAEPFYGPVFKSDVFTNESNVPVSKGYLVRVETEFVIGVNRTLTGKPDGVSNDEIMAAIDWIAPGFELIGSRIKNIPTLPGHCAIADGGGSHNVVLGTPVHDWQHYDWQQHQAALSINAKTVASGHSGDSIAGSPIGMLHWLLNYERFENQQLLAGQFVFCGTSTPPLEVNVGDTLEGDFGALGKIKAVCTNA